jgi:hypothetical protein
MLKLAAKTASTFIVCNQLVTFLTITNWRLPLKLHINPHEIS